MLSVALALIVTSSPVQHQVHQKRLEQLADLERIIQLSGRQPELLFRLADLWMEEEATTKAIALWAELAQEHPRFARADEVLFFLGRALLDANDEPRAVLAFKRLASKHPESRFVAGAHFALGEFLFDKANGRRDWLTRALAQYAAASGPDALYKQGWCLLTLQDFEGAQARFREVAKQGGARASEAERDLVLAYEKGGGKAAGAAALLEGVASASRRHVLTEQLARLYAEDGFDAEAAFAWQALIREAPRSQQALGYQQRAIEAFLRMGRRPLVVTQVQKLVAMAADLGGDVSAAEPLLAGLATQWHTECRKTREGGCLAYAGAIYEAYLTLFPSAARAYELRFFYAELSFAQGEYERAATAYRAVVARDVACRTSKRCEPGRFMEPAAWNEIQAREAIVQAALPHEGSLRDEAPPRWHGDERV